MKYAWFWPSLFLGMGAIAMVIMLGGRPESGVTPTQAGEPPPIVSAPTVVTDMQLSQQVRVLTQHVEALHTTVRVLAGDVHLLRQRVEQLPVPEEVR